jgi:aminopeptidase
VDPRVEAYADLLVDRCVAVQPGQQVLVQSTPLARPLVDAVVRRVARRGAYAFAWLNFESPINWTWVSDAPQELVEKLAPIEDNIYRSIDAWIHIGAPENTREGADVPAEKRAAISRARHDWLERRLSQTMAWVGCRFPTVAQAQDAGMTLTQFEDFLFGAVLIDWDALTAEMAGVKERFDRANEVRIVGHETDLTLSLAGREGLVDDGHLNMPGGEVFYSPVEDSAEGVVTFSEFPAVDAAEFVEGARMVYRDGRVVEASARAGEEFLHAALDRDEGARRLGELGIGCNPGITRHVKETLFDEKIAGTVHLAIGQGFKFLGGTNDSSVHWDMVKDLRNGGQLYCDGELVQENGAWRL